MRVRTKANASRRRGVVIVITALLLIFLFGLVAFAVDLGYLYVVQAELQASADSSALAATAQLLDVNALKGLDATQSQAAEAAKAEAVLLASMNTAGGKSLNLPFDSSTDLKLGYIADVRNPTLRPPNRENNELFNAVRVRLRRDSIQNGPVELFFAPVMGKDQQELWTEAIAVYEMGIKGFQVKDDNTECKLFPFTLHVDYWDDVTGDNPTEFVDNWRYDEKSGTVVAGSDGIPEIKLFPSFGGGKSGNTPGNFGTIDIGPSNNSTNELRRRIIHGPNASDLSHFPNNTIQLGPDGTLIMEGNTGISAGMKHALEQVIGHEKILPLFKSVELPGNNAQYTIVRFVGIRVLDFNLQGANQNKHITIQPAWVTDGSAISGGAADTSMFVTKPLSLVR